MAKKIDIRKKEISRFKISLLILSISFKLYAYQSCYISTPTLFLQKPPLCTIAPTDINFSKHNESFSKPAPPQAPPPPDLSNLCSASFATPAKLRELYREIRVPKLIYILRGDRARILKSLIYQGLPLWISECPLLIPSSITEGWIRPEQPISIKELFEHINDYPRQKTRRIVMYSGDSLEDFIARFSKLALLDPKELYDAYFHFSPYKEGGILARYYYLPYQIDAKSSMAYLIEKSQECFKRVSKRYLGSYDPAKFRRYLIIASIIQRESWRKKEMPWIAAVIYNRLKRKMKLQLDATLNYGIWSHKKVTPKRIRCDKSRFNTYRHYGLPPTPLGSVTIGALKAALNPAKSQDLYFVKGPIDLHIFTTRYADHCKIISVLKNLPPLSDSLAEGENNESNTSPQIGYNPPKIELKNLEKNGTQ